MVLYCFSGFRPFRLARHIATVSDFLAGHGETCHPHGWSTWRPADQPTKRRSTWTSCLFLRKPYQKSIRICVLWAGLRVAMWMARVGGQICLKTVTTLNKEVSPFFVSDSSIRSFPSFSSLSDYSIWRSWRLFWPCGHSIWSIWVHCPQILLYRLGKIDKRGLDSLI